MADRVEIRDITIPAGTLQAAPQITALTWRQGYPVRVEIRFPPGPSGLVGIQLRHSGVSVIPKDGSAFLVSDDEIVDWEVTVKNYSAKWTAVAYNTGFYPHTLQLRIHINEIGAQAITSVQQSPLAVPVTSSGQLLEGLAQG